ncbi:MAG: hypothetical protein ABMA14_11220 [Hyphomonadaceae bacterium]
MTVEPAAVSPSEADRLKKGQTRFMTGLAMVMLGMVFGGGLAMVFYFLGQRTGAIICAAAGVVVIGAGIYLQTSGTKLLRNKPQ